MLSGGIFNVFGDYFFVFTCGMGICGAGLATAIGAGISFLVMLTHFMGRRNTLRLVKPEQPVKKLREISVTGFSTFFIDVAMGILTVRFNRQIMKYLGANALAVYGPVIQVSTFVQCCAYSVGHRAAGHALRCRDDPQIYRLPARYGLCGYGPLKCARIVSAVLLPYTSARGGRGPLIVEFFCNSAYNTILYGKHIRLDEQSFVFLHGGDKVLPCFERIQPVFARAIDL